REVTHRARGGGGGGRRLPLTGHAARAVISTERRVQIWDQFYISFKETIPPNQWCTRQELVTAACSGTTGVKFTVDELTEVIRGRKHKREAGIDSQKVDGEWLYRFVPPSGATSNSSTTATANPSSTSPPPPAAAAKRPAPSSTVKPKAKPKTTPKRNGPLRPRAKSPAVKTPPGVGAAASAAAAAAGASRKRATPSGGVDPMTTRLRSGAKKARPSPRARGGSSDRNGQK
ncbi:unnamed protein product, partial [Ectocarpus fasciculatus]